MALLGRLRLLALAALAGTAYVELVAVHLLEEVVPYAVLGMFGGLLSAFRLRQPTARYVALSIGRSALVGFMAAQLLIGLSAERAMILFGTSIASYIAEELLSGIARLAGQWADHPLQTLDWLARHLSGMRLARGMPPATPPKEENGSDPDHRVDG